MYLLRIKQRFTVHKKTKMQDNKEENNANHLEQNKFVFPCINQNGGNKSISLGCKKNIPDSVKDIHAT